MRVRVETILEVVDFPYKLFYSSFRIKQLAKVHNFRYPIFMKIFSGIRPSGKLHLGNYLGAIKNWVELQHGADQAIYAVVDYHGITTPYDPQTYQDQVMSAVTDFLAAGIDPAKSLLIRQSKVPQHTELAWLFNTITPVGWLDRLPNYKEKVKQVEEATLNIETRPVQNEGLEIALTQNRAKSYQNNLALLAYPVLMAADILVYKSNMVPVGEDQLVHIDVTNEIAKKFNHLFPGRTGGETFEPVKPKITDGARIMSLQNATQKMSKTGDDGIALSDDADTIRGKIKRAVTDSEKEVRFDEARKPAISNLITIYSLLSGEQVGEIETIYAGKSYVNFKNDLAEVVVNFLKPIQDKYQQLKADPGYVMDVLRKSEEKARLIASTNLADIKARMGV